MAENSGFFNSSSGDRKYKAEFFAEYFATFIGNGVFPNPSTNLQVIANNDMTVTVKSGSAWINGYIYINNSDLILTIDVADGVLNRIDRIVLQYNTLDRTIIAKVKKGTFASSPFALTLQRDADAYELGIADVYVGAGVTSISQSNITDLRLDTTKCGIVHGTVDQVDTTTLFNQYQTWLSEKKSQYDTDITQWTTTKQNEYQSWYDNTTTTEQSQIDNIETQFQSDWDTWFTSVKNALSGDTAGNLLNMINGLAGDGRTTETVKGNADTLVNLNNTMNQHLADSLYQLAGGTATAITLTISETLATGLPLTFIASYTDASTTKTINGKKFYKPNTTTSPSTTAGKAYTAWYDTTGDSGNGCFFIKASAEGTAGVGDVLAGKTFSNDADTGLTGTMPNNASPTATITTQGGTKVIPAGYNPGGTVTANISNLIASNIVSGATVGGVAGSATIESLGGRRYATGSVTTDSTGYITISGLSFTPSIIVSWWNNPNSTMTINYTVVYSGTFPYYGVGGQNTLVSYISSGTSSLKNFSSATFGTTTKWYVNNASASYTYFAYE